MPSVGVTTFTTTLTGGAPTLGTINFQNTQWKWNNGSTAFTAAPSPTTTPWAAWTEPDRSVGVGYRIGTVSLRSSEAFRQIGHSLFTLLVAVLGGTFARHRFRNSVLSRPD